MGTLRDFVRKWGVIASYITLPDGTKKVVHVRQAHVALPDLTNPIAQEMLEEFAAIDFSVRRGARVRHPPFTNSLKINPSTARGWEFDEDNVVEAIYNPGGIGDGKLIEKFSWNPVTGEFLLVPPPRMHATVDGKAPFDDYVRGIILHDQRKITFRPFWPTWMQKDGAYSRFDKDAWEVSFDAQEAAEDVLRRHAEGSWTYQYNIDNKALQQQTGRYRW